MGRIDPTAVHVRLRKLSYPTTSRSRSAISSWSLSVPVPLSGPARELVSKRRTQRLDLAQWSFAAGNGEARVASAGKLAARQSRDTARPGPAVVSGLEPGNLAAGS